MQKSKIAKPTPKKSMPSKQHTSSLGKPQRAPIAESTQWTTRAPSIKSNHTSCRIVHEELVSTLNVTGSGFNRIFTKAINPGVVGLFPWLSSQSLGWEKYKFHRLTFSYRPRCSTTLAGSIMMYPDYDPSDVPPSSEIDASTHQNFKEDAPWKAMDVYCDKTQLAKDRYVVRPDAVVPVGMSLADFNIGNLYMFINGFIEFGGLGKLYVSYDIEFSIPQRITYTAPVLTLNEPITYFNNSNTSNTSPFGIGSQIDPSVSTLKITAAGFVTTITGLEIGVKYYINCYCNGAVFASISTPTTIGMSGGYTAGLFLDLTSYVYSRYFNATATTATITHTFVAGAVSSAAILVTKSNASF